MTVAASGCALCDALHGSSKEPWDRPILVTDDFVVLPSLGALAPGWLLIVPRTHSLRMADLPSDAERRLRKLRTEVRGLLQAEYSLPVIEFEHGPAMPGLSIGCTVDHAHLHAVTFSGDILANALRVNRTIRWTRVPSLSSHVVNPAQSYLYVADSDGRHFMTFSTDLPSQLLRRAVALTSDTQDRWNWRLFPRQGRAVTMWQALTQRISSVPTLA